MKKKKVLVLPIFLLLGVFSLSGCSLTEQLGQKALEKTIEAGTGGKVNIDADKQEMTIKGENGESMVLSGGENTTLPDNFPKDVFVFEDAKFLLVLNKSESDFSVVYTTEKSVSEAKEKYKTELSKNGWNKENESDLGEAIVFNFSKGERKMMVTVGLDKSVNQEGKTTVSLIAALNNEGTGVGNEGMETVPALPLPN